LTVLREGDGTAVSPGEPTIRPGSTLQVPTKTETPRNLTEFEVFHGTLGDFEKFSSDFLGIETGAPSATRGFFFTSEAKVAESYATPFDPYATGFFAKIKIPNWYRKFNNTLLKVFGLEPMQVEYGQILKTRIKFNNPLIVDRMGKLVSDKEQTRIIDNAKKAGHDGVIFKNSRDPGFTDEGDIPSDVFVVFDTDNIEIISRHNTAKEATAVRGAELTIRPGSRPAPKTGTDLAQLSWAVAQIETEYATALSLGVVDEIEAAAAKRLTAKQTVKQLGDKLKIYDKVAIANNEAWVAQGNKETLVRAVRSKLDIPSLDEKIDFEKWVNDYNKRQTETTEVVVPKGYIDAGDDILIPEDFAVALDAEGRTISARQFMDDLADDTDMIEAMRVCTL
jgi:cell fate (sporulation/competence/biofilm development) regulator YmcA (YheA/YmcA/DUF963 family)